ncbi:MAG: RluA family pseudouridine synthase [Burkholderiales bacterium]|jgi:23S rRNA pseudouridine955/2504/2580 synthase|nr:RluA family pseudouridine synthase [Burkholderiales bacterium]
MKDLSKDFVKHLEIDEASAGQRLDNFLMKTLKGVPKSHIYRIVRSGEVRVNGGRAQPSSHLAAGDTVRIPPLRLPARLSSQAEPRRPTVPRGVNALPVLFEDEWLLAVDKPAGRAVHGGSGVSFGAIEQLRAQRPELRFLELVHRLDRETSGVLLLAKKRSALTGLHAAWRDGAVDKRYDVLVRGRWPDAKRKVQVPLTRFLTAEGERRVRADGDGQAATTVFYRQRVWPDLEPPLSLLEAELHTGRTHQIRVHLTHLGYPLAGDDKYGDFAWNRALTKAGLRRMFLHARKLGFSHPASGEWLEIEAPLSEALQAFLDGLPAARETTE